MSYDSKFILCFAGMTFAVTATLLFLINTINKEQCLTRYADFQPEYHGIITGCLVQYNGKTVPAETLRVMD